MYKPCPSLAIYFFLGLLLFSFARANHAARAETRPNFVWLVSEDNSKHYLKLFDVHGQETPHIAALARDGIVFERAFSNAPVCSVARTTLITGCYAPRIGTQFHRSAKPASMPVGLKMFPAYLRAAGYFATNNAKKDYNAVEGEGVWDESSNKATWRQRPKPEQPFFHMQSFGQSHESSLHFGPEKRNNFETSAKPVKLAPFHPDTPTFRHTHVRYLNSMSTIDAAVGEVVKQLQADGLLENTFIFYFGDHGGVLPRSKGYLYETGLHVPLVVRVPEKFKHLVPLERGGRTQAFVEFVDFGPTLLQLGGLTVPAQVDGRPFLGAGITLAQLNERDEAFGYADRFDEKYDLCRSLRKGRYKYIRNYHPYYPDGLQNNYRYQMLAYREWRDLYRAGKLDSEQARFFVAKDAEALYDLQQDPYETVNLAAKPAHQETLVELRTRLQQRVKALPDLSFYPESYLLRHALEDPVAFGAKRRDEIARLVTTAEVSLLDEAEAVAALREALRSSNEWVRYWALISCTALAVKNQGGELEDEARTSLKDPNLMIRLRAVEFLGTLGAIDPQPELTKILNSTESPAEALLALNSVVYFNDSDLKPYAFDLDKLRMKVNSGEIQRRLKYLGGK